MKMLYYNRIEVSEGTDVNKTSESKVSHICQNWYFLAKGFKFQANVCNGCHDLLMMSVNLSHITILNIKSPNYCCIINKIIKREAINLMQNTNLTEEKGNIIKNKPYYHI